VTDQIRRSSRSVSANIAEATRKRKYEKHFGSKLTNSDAENAQTQVELEFANACDYSNKNDLKTLTSKSLEVGKLSRYSLLRFWLITMYFKLYIIAHK
jgi:four helix bundle protein